MRYVLVDTTTGRLAGVIMATGADVAANTPEGMTAIEHDGSADPLTQWYDGGEVVDRPVLPVTHSSLSVAAGEVVYFYDVPVGAIFYHPDGQETVNDGEADWSSGLAGDYVLRIECFPYTEGYYHVHVS